MKKLLILLFSLLFLSSTSVFADDISDFSIEGISIGDSLLDYMTEGEILEKIERTKDWYSYLNEPSKYSHIDLYKDFLTYDSITFMIQNNATNKYVTDKKEKYKILSIRGYKVYSNDFIICKQERNEIVEVLSRMFPDAQKKEQINNFRSDPSGKSIQDLVFFKLDSGAQIDVYCSNFDENFRIKKKWSDGLSVSILSAEIHSWLQSTK
jgi:hypothetical protein